MNWLRGSVHTGKAEIKVKSTYLIQNLNIFLKGLFCLVIY